MIISQIEIFPLRIPFKRRRVRIAEIHAATRR